jgi:toxin ParE1/3/4
VTAVARRIVLRARAQRDLVELYEHVRQARGASAVAKAYLRRIREIIESLEENPERGLPRDDIRLGLRILAVERRILIAYSVTQTEVVVGRVFFRGRDYLKILGKPGRLPDP